MNKKLSLNSATRAELADVAHSLGEKSYRGDQIFRWLHYDKISSIDEMSNLPKAFRNALENIGEITLLQEVSRSVSKRDGAVKLLFELEDGERVESVILRDKDRITGCISTQVGCRMGCRFCATAKIGFKRNLTVAEILGQIKALEKLALAEEMTEEGRLTNIVFMGMGEPLDNIVNLNKALDILTDENGYGYSYRRITVSTVGLTPKIKSLFNRSNPVNLAVSLNASNQKVRAGLMPVSRQYNLDGLLEELKKIPVQKRQKITLEYVLLGGINDTPAHARELVKLVKKLPVKINLIRYNGGGEAGLKAPEEKNVLAFQQVLIDNNLSAFIRKSLGADIFGACGQLAAGYGKKS